MFSNSFMLRLIKCLYIFILGNIYLFLGAIISHGITVYIAKDYDPQKTKFRNLLQLILEAGLIMVSVYIIRITVKHKLPHPFNGWYGFNPDRVKEMNGGVILAFAFLIYMKDPLSSKIKALYHV